MPRLLCLLADRAPYGSLAAGEAIRHAHGAMGKGWDVVLALMGDGVYTAVPRQAPPEGEWVPLGEAVSELLHEGGERARALVDAEALRARGLGPGDLIPGARPATLAEVAAAMVECDRTLVF